KQCVLPVIPIGNRNECDQPGTASPQFSEAFKRGIEGAEVLEFLGRGSTPLNDIRRENEQLPRVGLETERKMRRTGAPNGSTILRVTAEERIKSLARANFGLHSRHDRTAQRSCNLERIRLVNDAVDNRKDMYTRND